MSKDQVWKHFFSILKDQNKILFQTFPDWKITKMFPYFSRLRRNPGSTKSIGNFFSGKAVVDFSRGSNHGAISF